MSDTKCCFANDRETVIIKLADGTTRFISKITEECVKREKYIKMGSGRLTGPDSLFGAIFMGTRHYKGNFLQEVCYYHKIDDKNDKYYGGYTFYKEKE